ncbi:putative bifunctional diguanylate cyclase/phosphodiesterase [Sphingosinicella soli]|uniref:Diguanylate cyclase (GGDEF)-like protein/PAS domain S-box-containing protein n=1 Tax=Sphingosinicella soli TaxID=333708 RepID=A0A7W7AZC9_9SPHN|nr:EAL domain-containing protein [Sphingosinicella soli]MBB4631171.1 diguanylate cyclase (GGDEF)-like protein/PAS domain S-box-containing protein [Sphingosinicella soli]
MRYPSAILGEDDRLVSLREYDLEDKGPLPSLDPVVEIAARLFDMPVSAVNLVGSEHVFFAASRGIREADMRREVSFCAHVITQDDVLVVPDALEDPRFFDNPLTTGATPTRFYAGVPLRSPSGHALGVLCVIDSKPHRVFTPADRESLRDLGLVASEKLELRRMEVAASNSRTLFENSAATSPNAVICFDRNLDITAWNSGAETMFGYSSQEATGRSLDILMPAEEEARIRDAANDILANARNTVGAECVEYAGRHRDGSPFPMEFAWSSWVDDDDRHFAAIVRDVTRNKQQEARLRHLGNFDTLTGLANRNLLYRRLADAIDSGNPAALAIIDLDGFNAVNNTLGHEAGDELLRVVAERLTDRITEKDLIARVGGDEFAMMLVSTSDLQAVTEVVEGAMADLSVPIRLGGEEIRIQCSAGIAMSPLHAGEVRVLVANADLALFEAKLEGGGNVVVFEPALRMAAAARRDGNVALHRAAERNEFLLHYQPQFRLSDNALVGAEALMRWQHPELGLLQPAEFLSALEFSPLSASVGFRMLDDACSQAALWRTRGAPDFRVAVNLFASQIRDGNLVETVAATLERYALPPDALELEITESTILNQQDQTLPPLFALKAMGVGLAFDDYGTGYASLSLLKSYPLTHIKIDKSFVRGMVTSGSDRAIVAAIMDLARGFGLDVIGEGVETAEQRDLLRIAGCNIVQGDLTGRPTPPESFAAEFMASQDSETGESRARGL